MFSKPCCPAQSIVLSYRVCRLRAPCRLMLMGMVNDLRGEVVFKNMPTTISVSATSQAPSMYIHLTSSPVSESQMSFCQQLIISCLQQAPVKRGGWLSGPDCSLFTGGLPVVYQGSKVSATTPSSLMCVSIETTTGKAGRMLMGLSVGLWGSDVAVYRGKAEWIPSSLWTFHTEWHMMHDDSTRNAVIMCQINHLYTHITTT